MNYKQLKEFVNTLTDEQLTQSVRVCGEGFGATIDDINILEEDYIDPSGCGIEPKSLYLESLDSIDREIGESEEIVAKKGTIIMYSEQE